MCALCTNTKLMCLSYILCHDDCMVTPIWSHENEHRKNQTGCVMYPASGLRHNASLFAPQLEKRLGFYMNKMKFDPLSCQLFHA